MMDNTRDRDREREERRISYGNSFSSKTPTGEHWAIIIPGTIHHEGDQRSRDFPGHGYPSYTESTTSYKWYETEDAMKAALVNESGNSIGIHVQKIYKRVQKIEVV